jgi:hypothetical protein
MDAITYAAASTKVFSLDLGEIGDMPSEAEIPLSDKQSQELEGLIRSGKPFMIKISAIDEQGFNGMNHIDMFFLHSAAGLFYTILFGMTIVLIHNVKEKTLIMF